MWQEPQSLPPTFHHIRSTSSQTAADVECLCSTGLTNRSTSPHTPKYISLKKEYITLQEGKKWERFAPAPDEIGIYEPSEAPPLDSAILTLIDRVNSIDRDDIRLAVAPDHRLGREK